jgi:hypothetical protein
MKELMEELTTYFWMEEEQRDKMTVCKVERF